jgi:predicted HAD superfamily Cof-like phosphohydrolase
VKTVQSFLAVSAAYFGGFMLGQQFVHELAALLHKHQIDAALGTPDFVLAAQVGNVLAAQYNANSDVRRWQGVKVANTMHFESQDPEFDDVKEFHETFGQLVGELPRFLSPRKADERWKFMMEELEEFSKALHESDIDGMADALIDLVYVAKGTAVMMGLPWRQLWDDVHGANMRKVPGLTHRGNLVDVCKPKGWVKPRGLEILKYNGFDHNNLYCIEGADDQIHKSAPPTDENPIGGVER